MKKYLGLIVILSMIAAWPLLTKGFPKTHDGEWMLIRFTAFHQSLTEGQFPVRFTKRLNNNYGYPVLNFLYPGPFYLSEIPKLLGFSYIQSVKLTFIFTTIGSSLIMFWALSRVYSLPASMVGSVVYLFAPYRFVDLYVRGSLGENMAFFSAPLILGSIFNISKGSRRYLPILSVSTALLILSHNVLAVLFIPVLIGICTLTMPKKIFIQSMFYTLLGFAISAFFSIPALTDLKHVKLSQSKVTEAVDHLVKLKDLTLPSWGYSPNPNHEGGLSVQFGLVTIFIFLISIVIIIKSKRKENLPIFYLTLIVISSFLMSNLSAPIWLKVPFIDIIQFPWRLLSVTVLLSALLSAHILDKINKTWLNITIISVAVFYSFSYIEPVGFNYFPDSYYSTNEDTTTVQSEYLPLWVKSLPNNRAELATKINPDLNIIEEKQEGLKYKAKIESKKQTELLLNTIFFPGFKAKVNSEEVIINHNNTEGLIAVSLPQGWHEVIIYYGKTPIHLLSETISLFALLLTGVLFLKSWRNQGF